MKTIKQTLLIILALTTSASAFAQIAVVDSQAIFEQSKLTKEVNEKMKKLIAEAKTKMEKKESKLRKKQEELFAKRGVLSSDVYSNKEAELKREVLAFKEELRGTENELSIKNKQELQLVMTKISKIVDDLAKKEGYELVVSKSILMYSKKQIEITDKVLKILDSSN